MTTKQDLHKLVDNLPDSALSEAGRLLASLCHDNDPVWKAAMEAPEDDEPLTDEDIKAIEEAREDIKHGRTISNEELRRELGW